MDENLQLRSTISNMNKIFQFILVFTIYVKLFLLIYFNESNIILDILLYISLLLSVNYVRFTHFLIFVTLISFISVLNPALRNIFLVIVSTYILSALNISTILKTNLVILTVIFILGTCFLITGVTKSEMFKQTMLDMRERWDYGMGNPNTFSLFIYSIIVNFYLLFVKKTRLTIPIVLIIAFATYFYTYSRTFIVSVLLLAIFYIFGKQIAKHLRLVKMVLKATPVLLIVMIIYFSRNVNEYSIIDLALSGRLSLYSDFISSLSIKDYIIGTPKINEEVIDSSYLHIYFEGGIAFFSVFIIFYYKFINSIKYEESPIIVPYLFSVLCLSITESIFTYILMFGNMIFWIILFSGFRKGYIFYKS